MCATQGYSLVALISKAVSHFILRYFHLLAPCFRCFAAFFFAFLLWLANYFCLLFTLCRCCLCRRRVKEGGGARGELSALISRPNRRQYLLCTQRYATRSRSSAALETKANGKAQRNELSLSFSLEAPTGSCCLPTSAAKPLARHRHFAVVAQWCRS